MDKMDKKETLKSMRSGKRRLIQVYAALLYNAHIRGFIKGNIYTGNTKIACVPGLNCYSCPGAVGACPLGALQNALASSGKTAGFYVFGILILYGLIFGRTICGYLCPFGLIQELLYKIPTPKIRKGKATRILSYLKYVILAVFVFGITLWFGLYEKMTVPGFCKYICPAGTLEGAVGLLSNPANSEYFDLLGIIFARKLIIMIFLIILCIFCFRAFCRFLCPLGAIYSLFNRFSIIGVKVDTSKCNGCNACVRNCGMDVHRVGDHECINCRKCVDICSQKAISVKAGSITLKAHYDGEVVVKKRQTFERITQFIALAVLIFALIWFNFLDPSIKKENEAIDLNQETTVQDNHENNPDKAEAEIPIGYEVGFRLKDFEIKCMDGESFSVAGSVGKPVFINLWATYCGPCVKELPIFEEFYNKHKEEITLVAVHSSLIDDDPIEYVNESGLNIPFAIDSEDDTVWNAVGGSSTIPQTIILDKNGVVIYNKLGSINLDLLEALYTQAVGE